MALASRLRSNLALWVAMLTALIAIIAIQWPRISDPYVIEDDFRNQYWMHLFDDNELFQAPDRFIDEWIYKLPLGDQNLIIFTSSPAYSLIFQLFNQFIPFMLFAKLLIFPLTLFSVYYVFRIGEDLSNSRSALYLSLGFIVIALASTTTISTTAGLQRTFTFPLLLAFIYYLMVGRDRAALIVVFLAGVFYPPMFILCAATYGLSLIAINPRKNAASTLRTISINLRRAIPLVLVTILVMIALSPMLISRRQPDRTFTPSDDEVYSGEYTRVFWKAADGRHLLEDPYYKSGNRGELFVSFPFVGRAGLTLHGTSPIHLVVLLILFSLTWLLTRFKTTPIPYALKLFIAAVWLCYALAWISVILTSSFTLYYPSRYTEAGLILFLLIVVSLNLSSAVDRAAALLRKPKILFSAALPVLLLSIALIFRLSPGEGISGRSDPSDFRLPIIFLAIILVVLITLAAIRRFREDRLNNSEIIKPKPFVKVVLGLFALIGLAVYVYYFQAPFIVPSPDERELYSFLETLPDDAVLAGRTPARENSVYIFAKRQMLVACKDPKMDPLDGSLRAYYTEKGENESIVNFCSRCGVNYYLVDEKSYSEESLSKTRRDYQDSYLAEYIHSVSASTDFALRSVTRNAKLFQAGDFSVVACDVRLLEE